MQCNGLDTGPCESNPMARGYQQPRSWSLDGVPLGWQGSEVSDTRILGRGQIRTKRGAEPPQYLEPSKGGLRALAIWSYKTPNGGL